MTAVRTARRATHILRESFSRFSLREYLYVGGVVSHDGPWTVWHIESAPPDLSDRDGARYTGSSWVVGAQTGPRAPSSERFT
ncbi:hypothetical protein ACWC4A_54455, partial [Streptomyces mirabilis]